MMLSTLVLLVALGAAPAGWPPSPSPPVVAAATGLDGFHKAILNARAGTVAARYRDLEDAPRRDQVLLALKAQIVDMADFHSPLSDDDRAFLIFLADTESARHDRPAVKRLASCACGDGQACSCKDQASCRCESCLVHKVATPAYRWLYANHQGRAVVVWGTMGRDGFVHYDPAAQPDWVKATLQPPAPMYRSSRSACSSGRCGSY